MATLNRHNELLISAAIDMLHMWRVCAAVADGYLPLANMYAMWRKLRPKLIAILRCGFRNAWVSLQLTWKTLSHYPETAAKA